MGTLTHDRIDHVGELADAYDAEWVKLCDALHDLDAARTAAEDAERNVEWVRNLAFREHVELMLAAVTAKAQRADARYSEAQTAYFAALDARNGQTS